MEEPELNNANKDKIAACHLHPPHSNKQANKKQKPSNQQNLIVYTYGSVTKDQSGWGFTVKRGATTIREDSAVYTVSTSSLTMEVEALCWIASRGDSQNTLLKRKERC